MSFANTGIRIVAPPSSTANRSSEIVARMIGVRQTNRTPSVRLRNVAGSRGRSDAGVRTRSRVSRRMNDSAHATSITYAAVTPHSSTTPAIAGPTTDAIWKMLLFQVTALLKIVAGTICGSMDDRAGQPVACATAPVTSSTYTSGIGPWKCDSTASPADDSAQSTWLTARIFRRSKRSASCPAGRASRISGSACARPIQPSISGSTGAAVQVVADGDVLHLPADDRHHPARAVQAVITKPQRGVGVVARRVVPAGQLGLELRLGRRERSGPLHVGRFDFSAAGRRFAIRCVHVVRRVHAERGRVCRLRRRVQQVRARECRLHNGCAADARRAALNPHAQREFHVWHTVF